MPVISKRALTEAAVRRLRPGGRLMDSKLIGFGVRRSPKTRRVAFFVRRVINGVEKSKTIGIHPQLSVSEARRVAHRSIATIERRFAECKECKHASASAPHQDEKLDRILTLVSPNRPTVTVGALIEAILPGWLAPLKSSTQREVKRYMRYVKRDFGDVPAAEINNGTMVRWHEKLSESGPAGARSACKAFILLLKKAVDQNLLKSIPGFRIKYAKTQERLPVTRETIHRFVAALEGILSAPATQRNANHSCANAVIMVLNSGERASAACSLHRDEVDYENKVIVKSRKFGQTVQIPASDYLIKFLRSIEHPRGFYFPFKTGPITYSTLRKFVKKVCEQHSILDTGGRRPTLHSFRHTYASMLAEKGLPVTHIQRLLGHSSMTSTLRYIHAMGPEVYRSANSLDIARVKLRDADE